MNVNYKTSIDHHSSTNATRPSEVFIRIILCDLGQNLILYVLTDQKVVGVCRGEEEYGKKLLNSLYRSSMETSM